MWLGTAPESAGRCGRGCTTREPEGAGRSGLTLAPPERGVPGSQADAAPQSGPARRRAGLPHRA